MIITKYINNTKTKKIMEKIELSKTDNILFNLQGGLLPKDLTKGEIELLEKEYGKDWFIELGYDEKTYEKPNI